ncbi:transporter [Aureitalea marina]|uniref:Transporter n=1 Tax=Aureitalea marina TaxID=930804 RepID=A0A2S7KPG7_9FLAO|nr:transporter [Aureitalea marina]PQB04500.1 hypothetical protein BST85_05995 [Aureitalea marina]
MNNLRIPLLLLALLVSPMLFGQYTDLINTNQPGGSQGAFSVGTRVLQLETGVSFGNEKHELLVTDTDAFNWDYSIRYGVWKEELEVSLMGSLQSNNVVDSRGAVPFEQRQTNFKSNTLGAKYLIYDPYRKRDLEGPNLYSYHANNSFQWKDLVPAVAVYAGANFDSADNPFTQEDDFSISPKVVIATQNNFLSGFVLVTNLIADRITTDAPTYGYVVTLTYSTNRYFSVFLENQGFKSDFYSDQLLRGGAAVLINQDFHVDLSGTLNFKDTPSLWYVRAGLAYRLDMHNKDEYIEDKGRSGRDKKREEKAARKAEKKKKKNKRRDGVLEDDGGR